DAREPKLRLHMAGFFARGREVDFDYAAEQVEQVAAELLAKFGPGQTPTRADFRSAGFTLEKAHEAWTDSFYIVDLDGDGSNDILFATQDYSEPSACCLFRHTAEGWKKHRLIAGAEIMGVWIFDVQKGGPKVIEVASLADSDYDPNMLVDV